MGNASHKMLGKELKLRGNRKKRLKVVRKIVSHLFGYSGAIFERLKVSFHRLWCRKTCLPCTADLERRDYLDFLPKRPQGTTKILGASAFAGTKTPAALKFPSKGATTDCVETPVNCPHCGQK